MGEVRLLGGRGLSNFRGGGGGSIFLGIIEIFLIEVEIFSRGGGVVVERFSERVTETPKDQGVSGIAQNLNSYVNPMCHGKRIEF